MQIGDFMGVTGVHPQAGLSTGDFEEAAIKRACRARGRNSRARVVV
jgi:DeoR/GlpR family transcriptional regulator of sugar metabolism